MRDIEESKQINNVSGRAVIIAGSGMLHGGRILHHLKHNIWKKENAVIFVGYQAKGTLGRLIVEKEKEVNILGESFKVNALIHTINGFSSHADQNELIEWITAVKTRPQKVCLVHGDENVMNVYKGKLEERGFNVYIPGYGEEIGF